MMTAFEDRLRDADPVRHEAVDAAARERMRATVLAAAAQPPARSPRTFGRRAALAALGMVVLGAAAAGSRLWFGALTLHAAAVRFEIRLAESTPAPDLQSVRVDGSDRVIYLHRDAVVTNDDVADARVVAGDAPDQFHVAVTLTTEGGEKMRAATAAHLDRPMALLIDGEVVMAPTVRSVVGTEGLLTGNYTREEAEHVATGMMLR
jgi:hypothetical protein